MACRRLPLRKSSGNVITHNGKSGTSRRRPRPVDSARELNRFLQEGGESRFMEALHDALRAEDSDAVLATSPEASAEAMKAKFAATDDGLDIPGFLQRAP
jgi:hypothetical protein